MKDNLMAGGDVVCWQGRSTEPSKKPKKTRMYKMVPLDTPWNKSSCLSLRLNFSHFQEVSNTTASNVNDVRFCPHPPVSPG